MKNTRFVLSALAALAVTPALATAQNTLSGQMQWGGVNKSFVWYWADSHGNVYGAYGGGAYGAQLQFNSVGSSLYWPNHGTSGFGPTVDIYCVDFLHEANISSAGYNAYFTNLSGSLTNTRLADADKFKYLEAAYLADQMETYGTTTLAGKLARAQIHSAMWWILSGEPSTPGGTWNGVGSVSNLSSYFAMDASNSWVQLAQANWNTVDAGKWTVVTDACVSSPTVHHNGAGEAASDNCSQEFLTRSVVPEPATLILLGTGLALTLAMAGLVGKQQTT